MVATTDIQTFALGGGANVLSPSAYAALTALIASGYQAGTALSVQVNTTLRQSSFMAAALANFLVSQGISQPDDGNLTNAVANIQSAIRLATGNNSFTGGTTTGSASTQVLASLSPSTGFSLSNNGQVLAFTAGFAPTGTTTLQITSPAIAATAIKKPGTSGSLVNLTGNEWGAGETVFIAVNTTAACYELLDSPPLGTVAPLNLDNSNFIGNAGNLAFGTGAAANFIVGNAIGGFVPASPSGTSTTAAIVFGAGQAVDSTVVAIIKNGSTINWAVANGNAINGYSGGTTLPNSSTIHFYACSGASGTGIYAVPNGSYPLAAASAPIGYNSYVRRVFSCPTNSSGTLLSGNAVETNGGGLIYWYGTQILDVNVVNLGTTRTQYSLSVPSGPKVKPLGRSATNGAGTDIIFTSGDETDVAPTSYSGAVPLADIESNANSGRPLMGKSIFTTNTSGQIGARAVGASTALLVVTSGFEDFRRG